MKRLISLICVLALACSGISFAEEESSIVELRPYFKSADTLEAYMLPLYIESESEPTQIELFTVNGISDIPYISIEGVVYALTQTAAAVGYDGYALTVDKADNMVILNRENGALALLDFNSGTITINDPDLFSSHPGAVNGLDVIEPMTKNEQGEITLFDASAVSFVAGSQLVYDLAAYNIFTFWHDGTGYIPLQTFSDVFLSRFPLFALCNGDCVIIASSVSSEELSTLYYNGNTHKNSEELTCFNYYELCLALDNTYGLKEEHGIDSFMSYFAKTSLVKKLLTTEPGDTYAALMDLTCGYFADSHSAPNSKSYAAAEGSGEGDPVLMTPMFDMLIKQLSYVNARNIYYPNGVPGYEEVGNTAYITFDHFVLDYSRDYYNTQITNTSSDTVELLIYANSQIKREDSPIENVVLDLSLNGGGMIPAAMFTVSWFLGASSFNLVNTKTGAQSNISYRFDTSLNHVIDDMDSLTDMFGSLNLYCLIGSTSFSCANLVPAAFKSSGSVTLIGKTTGGGACSVCVMSTADGNVFQLSSSLRANTIKNGIFYSVDTGVEPDVYIDKIEHLYDREYLTQLINNLD